MPDEVKAPAPVERRAAALEQAFEERNLVPAGFVDEFARIAREDWVLANGVKVVARAWTDADFRRRLLENGKAAVAELGFTMPEHHKHLAVLENTSAPPERDLLHAVFMHGVRDHRAAAGMV
jgi:nitrile hydratase